MTRFRASALCKIVAVLLCLVFVVPSTVHAAEPRASYYLSSYTSYICHMGGGDLEIWFRVTGVGTMADIGVLTIILYESEDQINWTRATTFRHNDYEEMLDHDSGHHMSHVEYQGNEGKYYKAYVTIWAGSETDGDARYIWTPVEYASPLNP